MSISIQKTRVKILQATLDLLSAGDNPKIRMADVAKRAGVSRQAVYLHFKNRADLLIAATVYLDQQLDSDARLAPSRAAVIGVERLDAFVLAWGNYIPEIYGPAKAIITMGSTDPSAALAWQKRMADMREGCEAAIAALEKDGTLAPEFEPGEAADILWNLLSIAAWEHGTLTCGWSQEKYIKLTAKIARKLLYHP